MTYQTKNLGARGEELAASFLKTKKYQILQQNLRTKFGEVDILARDGQDLIIVEVKTKTTGQKGYAIEMITPTKQKKLILLAHQLQLKYQTNRVRIDVVTVDSADVEPKISLHRGVVEYHGR